MSKILIVGAGNMGFSFATALKKIIPQDDIFVVDKNTAKLQGLFINNISTDASDFLDQVDTVLLAIKPQVFESFCLDFKDKLKDKFVISIMAGVSLSKIQNQTGSDKVIRSMPNLAVSVERSVIGWIASKKVDETQKSLITKIFDVLGFSFEVKKELELNFITALCGSGPAYFFYLTEILQEQALEFGFDSEIAKKLAENTLFGASKLIQKNDLQAKTWKEKVTSKGGTTEAALLYLYQNDFAKIFKAAIQKANQRSQELS